MDIRLLGSGDEAVLARIAPDVFDDALHEQKTREFLADPRHHLAVALDAGLVVGFITAVHYVHPDKPVPELWINEVGVAASHRGRGVGRALLTAILDHARALGCAEAWVLTERTNAAAVGLYTSLGGSDSDAVMFSFSVSPGSARGT